MGSSKTEKLVARLGNVSADEVKELAQEQWSEASSVDDRAGASLVQATLFGVVAILGGVLLLVSLQLKALGGWEKLGGFEIGIYWAIVIAIGVGAGAVLAALILVIKGRRLFTKARALYKIASDRDIQEKELRRKKAAAENQAREARKREQVPEFPTAQAYERALATQERQRAAKEASDAREAEARAELERAQETLIKRYEEKKAAELLPEVAEVLKAQAGTDQPKLVEGGIVYPATNAGQRKSEAPENPKGRDTRGKGR